MTGGQQSALLVAIFCGVVALSQRLHGRDPLPALVLASAALLWAVW